jgi:hypothetical protein
MTIPLLANILPLVHIVQADPRLIDSGLQEHVVPGFLPGWPAVDIAAGVAYQPAAREALRQWLSGSIPWWDHYQGIGFPLAGELMAGAFSPFLWLLLVPDGIVLQQIIAQIACGVLTYIALRMISCGISSSLVGAALFELNSAFAWLGSFWCHPLIALPLSVIGVELLRRPDRRASFAGMLCLSCATYLAIGASFIEIGYLDGLLVVGWLLVRMSETSLTEAVRLLTLSSAAFVVGIMLAAPQLVALLDAIEYWLASHSGGLFGPMTLGPASIPQLVLPYVWGQILQYNDPALFDLWHDVGGYLGIAPIVVASAALTLRKERRMAYVLGGWIVLTVGARSGIPFMVWLINLIPGMSFIWQSRYSSASTEFALAVLCALLLSEWRSLGNPFLTPIHRWTLAALGLSLLVALAANADLLHRLARQSQFSTWPIASAGVALLLCGSILLLMRRDGPGARRLIGAAIVAEALAWYAIPTMSLPRSGTLDENLVTYLQGHLGYDRLYSLDRLAPNYGTYYQLSAINYTEPMVPETWAHEVRTTLDPASITAFFFLEYRFGASNIHRSREAILAANRPAFAALSLRYVIDRPGPMEAAFPSAAGRPRVVYHDDVASIYRLPDARPYAEADHCRFSIASRDDIEATCAQPSRLIRRELYYPGWSVRVNAQDRQIRSFSRLFQQVELPRGHSLVQFAFAPERLRAAFVLWSLALVLLATGAVLAAWPARRRPVG